jgi:hypothetical protein
LEFLTGLVPRHGEAGLGRGEGLALLVLAGGGAPPPLLVHERAVGGVDQAQHRVVDMDVVVQVVDQLGLAADHAGDRRGREGRLAVEARVGRHPDPHQALGLDQRILPYPNFRDVQRVVGGQGRDLGAGPVGAEPPAVIGTFDGLADPVLSTGGLGVRLAGRQLGGAVRADVAQGVDGAGLGAADQDRLAQIFAAFHLARLQVGRQGRHVPGVHDEAFAEFHGFRNRPSGQHLRVVSHIGPTRGLSAQNPVSP